jgi:hypothetical protein
MKRFLGITRERVFSPGRVHDDAAILEMVADRLRQLGHHVMVCRGDDAAWPEPDTGTVVFTMCQGVPALARLREWQLRGVRIVNSPEGILNCRRARTVAAFAGTGIPFPETVLVDTGAPPAALVGNAGAWVKRADVHATDAGDVVYVDDVAAARRALQRLRARGIEQAVLQRHIPGAVLKFYAVRGRFFSCVPPPGAAAPLAEVLRRIDALGQDAAQRLQVDVYGGDCVYGKNGGLYLIDLNDWPSYAACRAEAASTIAAFLQAPDRTGDQ